MPTTATNSAGRPTPSPTPREILSEVDKPSVAATAFEEEAPDGYTVVNECIVVVVVGVVTDALVMPAGRRVQDQSRYNATRADNMNVPTRGREGHVDSPEPLVAPVAVIVVITTCVAVPLPLPSVVVADTCCIPSFADTELQYSP